MGDDFLPPNASNPKGFFESTIINTINEDILESVAPKRPIYLGDIFFKRIPLKHQRWLLALDENSQPKGSKEIEARIVNLTNKSPYCFKDPRFSYTLPIWRPFLENAVFVVVFREPSATANSIIKECKDSEPLHSLSMNRSRALKVWKCMYSRVLSTCDNDSNWLFVHFDQIVQKTALDRISQFTGAVVDYSFPDIRLKRSLATRKTPRDLQSIYDNLCRRAKFGSFA